MFHEALSPPFNALLAAGRDFVTAGRPYPDKVFALLEMHRTLDGLQPPLQSLMHGIKACRELLAGVAALQVGGKRGSWQHAGNAVVVSQHCLARLARNPEI